MQAFYISFIIIFLIG